MSASPTAENSKYLDIWINKSSSILPPDALVGLHLPYFLLATTRRPLSNTDNTLHICKGFRLPTRHHEPSIQSQQTKVQLNSSQKLQKPPPKTPFDISINSHVHRSSPPQVPVCAFKMTQYTSPSIPPISFITANSPKTPQTPRLCPLPHNLHAPNRRPRRPHLHCSKSFDLAPSRLNHQNTRRPTRPLHLPRALLLCDNPHDRNRPTHHFLRSRRAPACHSPRRYF
jgi:hypothetical protein